nr:hypothetical protein [Tanacetum cinerariifolium]
VPQDHDVFFRYTMFLYSCYLCYVMSLYPFTERYAQPYFFSCFDTADGKPVTCCKCEGLLRGGFCLFCNSKAENSFTYDPDSFNNTSSNFNHFPQPQYETYLCKLCGNDSHYGYDCQPQFLFVYKQEPSYNQNYNDNHYPHNSPSFLCCDNCRGSHATFQCQPMDKNINSSGFDKIQSPQYPVIHHPSQEMSKEVFQAKGNLMKSIQTFLEKFNFISLEKCQRFYCKLGRNFVAILHAQPEDTNELFQKLIEDLHIINEELAEYINSLSWNNPTFNNNEEYSIQCKEYLENSSNATAATNFNQEKEEPPQNSNIRQFVRVECGIKVCEEQKQNMKDTLLELLDVCRQKEFYCMHNDISLVNAIAPVLPTEEPEYSLSMGYEHLSIIPETESDEVIEFSAKNLVPIPSEYESLSEKDVSMEDFKVYSNSLFDNEEINSDKVDSHYFNAESDLIESLSKHDTLIDSSSKFDYLKEFSGKLMPTSIIDEERIKREHEEYIILMKKLLAINSFPCLLENFHSITETLPSSPILVEDGDSLREEIDIFTGTDDFNDSISLPKNESSNFDHQNDPSFPRPPPKPPDDEFFFDLDPNSGELISAVINNIDEFNEDECFDSGGEIDVFANIENDDYFPFIFVIRIFLPYLIYPKVSPILLSTGSEDTIFDHGISV